MPRISKDDIVIMKFTNGETVMATYIGFNEKRNEHVIREPLNITVIDNNHVSCISAGMWLPLLDKDSSKVAIPISNNHTLTIVKSDSAINEYYRDSIRIVKEKRKAYTNPDFYQDEIREFEVVDEESSVPVHSSNTALH